MLKEGDRNTAFYHGYAKSRGTINRIDHKILSDGFWVDDQSQIQTLAVNHFSSVANSAYPDPSNLLFRIDSSKVTADQNTLISIIPNANEIRTAVFALEKDNSLGPDGHSGYFFTTTWQSTSPSVVKAVQHFFLSGKLYRASNTYFLKLIPKSTSPSSFAYYKPISLLNFTYKIIIKILAS